MNFPDFNTWHKVPDGITIPEGTPVLMLAHQGDYAFTGSFKQKIHHSWLVAEYYIFSAFFQLAASSGSAMGRSV